MTDQERERYPELAKVHDLKEKHSDGVINHVQQVVEYMFEEYVITNTVSDYPTSKSAEQICYEFWGIDYKTFKQEWNDRFEELLSETK